MDRKFEQHDGYIIAIPVGSNSTPTVPLVCPTCELVMSTRDDIISYSRWCCCSWCERMWVQGDRRDMWRDGWRPDRHVVESTLRVFGML